MRNNVAQKRHKKFIQTGFLELVSLLVNEAIYFHLKKCKTLTCSSFLTWPRRSFVHSPASPLSTLSNYAVIFSAHRTPQVYSLCLRAFAHPDNSSCPPSTTTSVHLKWFLWFFFLCHFTLCIFLVVLIKFAKYIYIFLGVTSYLSSPAPSGLLPCHLQPVVSTVHHWYSIYIRWMNEWQEFLLKFSVAALYAYNLIVYPIF